MDTFKYFEELIASGMPDAQAKVEARALQSTLDGVATKTQLEHVRLELKAEIVATKTQLEHVRLELKAEIKELKAEFKAEIQEVKLELKAEIKELKNDVDDLKIKIIGINSWMKFIAIMGASMFTILCGPVLQDIYRKGINLIIN